MGRAEQHNRDGCFVSLYKLLSGASTDLDAKIPRRYFSIDAKAKRKLR